MIAETSEIAAKILLINPIAQIIQDIRYSLITHETITIWNFIGEEQMVLKFLPIVITFILLVWGAWYFRKKSKKFAEEI